MPTALLVLVCKFGVDIERFRPAYYLALQLFLRLLLCIANLFTLLVGVVHLRIS